MTKEELLKQNAKLQQEVELWEEKTKRLRAEFAKAFNWYESKKQFDYGDRKLKSPSWEEIFVEVGKLLSARTFYDLEGNVSENKCAIGDLRRLIEEIEVNNN